MSDLDSLARGAAALADALSTAPVEPDDASPDHRDHVLVLINAAANPYSPPVPRLRSGRIMARHDDGTIDVELPPAPRPEPLPLRRRRLPPPQPEVLRRVRLGEPGQWRPDRAYVWPEGEDPPALTASDLARPPSSSPPPSCGRCGSTEPPLMLVAAARAPHEFLVARPVGRRICERCLAALDVWISTPPAASVATA